MSESISILVAILCIAFIGIINFIIILGLKKKNKKKSYIYTDKDRDMMKLIHELSTIYANTEEYLNKYNK